MTAGAMVASRMTTQAGSLDILAFEFLIPLLRIGEMLGAEAVDLARFEGGQLSGVVGPPDPYHHLARGPQAEFTGLVRERLAFYGHPVTHEVNPLHVLACHPVGQSGSVWLHIP